MQCEVYGADPRAQDSWNISGKYINLSFVINALSVKTL